MYEVIAVNFVTQTCSQRAAFTDESGPSSWLNLPLGNLVPLPVGYQKRTNEVNGKFYFGEFVFSLSLGICLIVCSTIITLEWFV